MESKDYLKDISEIKDMMNRSSRFISLSGLSGVLAGVYALVGAFIAYRLVENSGRDYLILDGYVFRMVVLILGLVCLLSIVTAIVLANRKAKKKGAKIWDATTKRLIVNFLIPFVTGGLYILIILDQQKYGFTSALMLIFYGLALINASKYSIGDIQYLGMIQVVLGLACALFPGYGFWFWVLGFGVMHIVYGAVMYFKLDRD